MSSLRVMTYNVRYFGHGTRGVVATRGGLNRIAASIAAMDPLVDVVCLQEVDTRSLRSSPLTWARSGTMLDGLMRALDGELAALGHRERYQQVYFPAHRYALAGSVDLYTTGLAILVRPRVRVIEHNAAQVTDITHRRGAKALKQTRICAHAALEADDVGQLDVFNTHMSLPGPFYADFWMKPKRLGYGPNQQVEARRLIEAVHHRRRSEHVVLLGDFNALPNSPVDRIVREEGGLSDALADAHGLAGGRLEAWSTAGFMRQRMNIDRIYSSDGIRWIDFADSKPFDGRDGVRNRFDGLSDHVPLIGTLSIRAPQGEGSVAAGERQSERSHGRAAG